MNIERKISRREFLIGAGLAIIAAGCKRAEEKLPVVAMEPSIIPEPTQLPTERPTAAPTPKPTQTLRPTAVPTVPTPEATSTPEPKRILSTTITQEYLKSAFAGIGGGEMVEGEKEKMSLIEFGQDYVSQTWGEEVDFKTLAEDPIASLKYLVSLGSYRGEEGIFYPGRQGEEVIFPQIGDLSLARLTLKNIPSQTEQEYKEWITPLNFLLRPGTQMTVVGEFKTREEAEFNYALVAFTDYLRASEESGVPRHYLVIIPTLTLANLLEANKYEFNSQTDEVTIAGEDGQKTILELNQIKSEELTDKIRKACGLYFVDQIKGELIKNPVVPYPQEIPSVWEIEEVKDEEGNVNLILRGQDQEGKFQDFSRARYDGEKGEWVWEKTVLPEPTPILSPEEQQFYSDITRVFAFERSPKVQSLIIGELERAKTIDPQKSGLEADRHYLCYTSAASFMKAIYYASGGSPQKRNKEMLKLLAQVRELARQNPTFDESNWVIEGVDSY